MHQRNGSPRDPSGANRQQPRENIDTEPVPTTKGSRPGTISLLTTSPQSPLANMGPLKSWPISDLLTKYMHHGVWHLVGSESVLLLGNGHGMALMIYQGFF
ncbi:hypothetical protein BaRGS_00002370 [Batillaria attramentaria]|uniref:Uncharacterized protein n=1 Tax=Batillaria attramentaria TaxID=370345 RepID=A0ABD0M3I5_9CAEN